MRLIDVVLTGVVLGLLAGYLQMSQPSASGVREAHAAVSERITWLWTPALGRRTSSVQ